VTGELSERPVAAGADASGSAVLEPRHAALEGARLVLRLLAPLTLGADFVLKARSVLLQAVALAPELFGFRGALREVHIVPEQAVELPLRGAENLLSPGRQVNRLLAGEACHPASSRAHIVSNSAGSLNVTPFSAPQANISSIMAVISCTLSFED
jgi:hypothetical protein